MPTNEAISVAKRTGATQYDIEGVEFAHEGDRCSFDTIIRIYKIEDATSRHDLRRNVEGCSPSLSHGMVIYDALYQWCRDLQAETHNWPARKQS
jgi:hypothetical protein